MNPRSLPLLLLAALAACSGGGGADAGDPSVCTSPALEVYFSPMYSASDGVHTFQIPAIVSGVAASALTWYSSDRSMVDIQPDPTIGGAMITTKTAGQTNIVPSGGGLCGVSQLTITSNTPDQWDAGYMRYNEAPMPPPDAGLRSIFAPDGGSAYIACTYCHGATATSGLFQDIAHTPEQTGGFSDSDLTSIITQGQVPGWSCDTDGGGGFGGHGGKAVSTSDAGYFDETIVPYCFWTQFHRWPMSSQDELAGVICYLRSLTPAPQNGSADFGGHGPGHGGHGGPGGGAGPGGGGSSSGGGGGTTG